MLMDKFCVVCILNQVIRVCGHLNCSSQTTDKVFNQALKVSAGLDFRQYTAPEFAKQVYKSITSVTGVSDPYKDLRKSQNDMVLKKADDLRKTINSSADPLYTAALFSLAGNIIDYGGVDLFDTSDLFREMDASELTINDFPAFKNKVLSAERITIIADNAGEAVFDLLLIEAVQNANPEIEIYYAVRSGPAINDIMRDDAVYIGIDKIARIIETGADFAGTRVKFSTEQFQKIYFSSDIVVSKGQGNFETLETEPEDLVFIFKVKCQVVADYLNLKSGSLIFAFKSSLTLGKGL